MNSEKSPKVYLILGTPDSGRREMTFDLIDGSFNEECTYFVLINKDEESSEFNSKIQRLANTKVLTWSYVGSKIVTPTLDASAQDSIFLIGYGRADLVEQIEKTKEWLKELNLTLTRVISVIDCTLASVKHITIPWFDALVHFSDCVLLNRREGIPNKWIQDFIKKFEKLHYPCIIEQVVKRKVQNPAFILDTQVNRYTHFFEVEDNFENLDFTDSNVDKEILDPDAKVDPYMEKLDNGQRKIKLPNIIEYL